MSHYVTEMLIINDAHLILLVISVFMTSDFVLNHKSDIIGRTYIEELIFEVYYITYIMLKGEII